jgi:hypothetical protein
LLEGLQVSLRISACRELATAGVVEQIDFIGRLKAHPAARS